MKCMVMGSFECYVEEFGLFWGKSVVLEGFRGVKLFSCFLDLLLWFGIVILNYVFKERCFNLFVLNICYCIFII